MGQEHNNRSAKMAKARKARQATRADKLVQKLAARDLARKHVARPAYLDERPARQSY